MKSKLPLVIFFSVFIIGFWVWFQKVIKTQKKIPISKDVICETKKRIIEIDNIAKKGNSPEDVITASKEAIFQLTFIGNPVAPYLISASLDKKRHRYARMIYIQILAAIENKEAIPSLCEILKSDPDYLLRMQSAISLGMIKDESVILPLKDALFDKEMVIRVASASGLIKIGRKDLVDQVVKNDQELRMYLEKWKE